MSSPAGQDQDWSAIAAVQCRLDREGATKLVADLIMNTKNEKIFQESILLAIRLLDGGNTEIQVLVVGTSPRGLGSRGLMCAVRGSQRAEDRGTGQSSAPGRSPSSRLYQNFRCMHLLAIWGRNCRNFSAFGFSSLVAGCCERGRLLPRVSGVMLMPSAGYRGNDSDLQLSGDHL